MIGIPGMNFVGMTTVAFFIWLGGVIGISLGAILFAYILRDQ